jgi:putative Ca2+/H+ antiporter (TMEM165/GDT1 family)
MFSALLFSFGAVVLAEMGDKTQLLAMAFAAKYSALKVMIGVFVATVINHALAVVAGNLLTRFSSAQTWVQITASVSFLFFALWTIRGDKLDGEHEKPARFGAIVTVGIAFFIAEMGDKTQLTTIALAAKFPDSPAWILMGTTLGMLVADGFGIIIGTILKKRIPERTVKLVSAGAFAVFGLIGMYQSLTGDFLLPLPYTAAILAAAAIATGLIALLIIRGERRNSATVGDMTE